VSRSTSTSLARALLGPAGGGFRRFWLATAVSVFGTWMAAVALAIRMYDVTGSPAWVSALLFADFTPAVVIGFALGGRLDRLPIRTALVACDLSSAAVFAVLAAVRTPWAVVALAGCAGVATGVFRPLSAAAVPLLVADDDMETATGAIGGADNAMTFLGELFGGVLVGAIGASAALGLNAVSFAASAALLATCTELARRGDVSGDQPRRWHLRETAARIRGSPVLRQIAIGWTIATFVVGVVLGVQIPLLRGTFNAEPWQVGVMLGLTALGLVAGSLFAGSRRFGRGAYPLALAGYGASVMIVGASPGLVLAGAGLALLGVFNGVAIVLNRTRAVRATGPAERASVISFLISLTVTAQAAGTIGGGLAATLISPRWAFIGFGLVALVVAAPLALSVGPRPGWELAPAPATDRDDRGP
jgi:MFS family permease